MSWQLDTEDIALKTTTSSAPPTPSHVQQWLQTKTMQKAVLKKNEVPSSVHAKPSLNCLGFSTDTAQVYH
jgi:hypothetical protein